MMIPIVIMAIESDDDRAYMTELYEQHRALMLKTAWNYTHVKADVEDIVSDSCTSLIINIDTIRGMEHNVLRSYIVTTVRNKAIDFCRKKQRTNTKLLYVDEEKIKQIAGSETIEQKIFLKDQINQVREALRCLPEREREILRLKYQKGLNDNEIADKVGLAASSVRKYIERARKHLKSVLY